VILVGEPAAVESERDPGRQANTGDRLGGESWAASMTRSDAPRPGVVHEGEDIAVVFGRAAHR
jgi:hypothetical protein